MSCNKNLDLGFYKSTTTFKLVQRSYLIPNENNPKNLQIRFSINN